MINNNRLYITRGNSSKTINNPNESETCSIGKKDIVKKYEIDILGKKSGEIKKCGEPLSLLAEKN